MFDNDCGTPSKTTWSEKCPWLLIFRTFRIAIDFRLLVMGAAGIFLTLLGWAVLGSMFSVDDDPALSPWMQPHNGCPWMAIDDAVPDRPQVPAVPNPVEGFADVPWDATNPLNGVWVQLIRPLRHAVEPDLSIGGLACLVLCGLWSLAIWAFFGAAISRIAAVQLGCDERVGWMPALRFACAKWRSYFAAPLVPAIGCGAIGLCIFIPGLLLNFNIGVLLVGLFLWPLLLLAGLAIAVLLLGLVLGWPLMWGTISTEGTDSFDALSRSYNYVFQRPLHYLFYALVAVVLGALGWVLVQGFASGVVGLTYQTAGWGAGSEEAAE